MHSKTALIILFFYILQLSKWNIPITELVKDLSVVSFLFHSLSPTSNITPISFKFNFPQILKSLPSCPNLISTLFTWNILTKSLLFLHIQHLSSLFSCPSIHHIATRGNPSKTQIWEYFSTKNISVIPHTFQHKLKTFQLSPQGRLCWLLQSFSLLPTSHPGCS